MPSFLRRGNKPAKGGGAKSAGSSAGEVVALGPPKARARPTGRPYSPSNPAAARPSRPSEARPAARTEVRSAPTFESRGSEAAAREAAADQHGGVGATTLADASFDDDATAGGRYCLPPLPSEIHQPALRQQRQTPGGVAATVHAPVKVLARPPLSSRLAGPIRSRGRPLGPTGRLFLRMPLHPGQLARDVTIELGDFAISIVLTEIDVGVVEAARRKVARDVKKHGQADPTVYNKDLETREDVETRTDDGNADEPADLPKLASLRVVHLPTGRVIWESAPGFNFLTAAAASVTCTSNVPSELRSRVYDVQTIDSIARGPSHVLTVRGKLGHEVIRGGVQDGQLPGDSPDYVLRFSLSPRHPAALDASFRVVSAADVGRDFVANQVAIVSGYAKNGGAAYFGLGGRTGRPDLRGLEVHVVHPTVESCRESLVSGSATSSAVPCYVTGDGTSVTVDPAGGAVTSFDFRQKGWHAVRNASDAVSVSYIVAGGMREGLELRSVLCAGRARPMPQWTQRRGAIVGVTGGTNAVQRVVKRLQRYGVPMAGVLIRDWTGIKPTSNFSAAAIGPADGRNGGSRSSAGDGSGGGDLLQSLDGKNPVWYNWCLERSHYHSWETMVDDLERQGISVGVYLNPHIEEVPVHLRSGRRYLFGEAHAKGYFVREPDNGEAGGRGGMYNFFRKRGRCGLIDVTNPKAAKWYKSVVKQEVLSLAGASFWLADLDTGAPLDCSYRNGGANPGLHNSYATEWARINREALRECGRDGDGFFVTPGAYAGTVGHAGATACPPDRPADPRRPDEALRCAYEGVVNSGLSGLTHAHSAVCLAASSAPGGGAPSPGSGGGAKSREAVCRWLEMAAFTALFRVHDGGAGDGAFGDDLVLRQLARWSHVYIALADYRLGLIKEASRRGIPVVRHPHLHYPEDGNFSRLKDEKGTDKTSTDAFMLGELMYIVPVLKVGVKKMNVYLPRGPWIHLWTGEQVTDEKSLGKTMQVECAVGEPPVFIRDCEMMYEFVSSLRRKGVIDKIKRKEQRERKISLKSRKNVRREL